jgi:hypothetical protein
MKCFSQKKNLTLFSGIEKIAQSLVGALHLLAKIVLQDGGEISHLQVWSGS